MFLFWQQNEFSRRLNNWEVSHPDNAMFFSNIRKEANMDKKKMTILILQNVTVGYL